MLTPVNPEASGLDRHQAGVLFLVDSAMRLALCVAIALTPFILKTSRVGHREKWFQLPVVEVLVSIMFLGIAVLLALCQMIRNGVL